MRSKFDDWARARYPWHIAEDERELAGHTLVDAAADSVVAGYLALLYGTLGWSNAAGRAIDLGAGAGHTTRAFQRAGIDMVATEHNEEGIALLRKHNPDMPVRLADMTSFLEPDTYGLIFAREVYAVTRVNAFSDQHAMLGRLIDSLTSGGVLLVAGSNACEPHCMEYAAMARLFASDARVRHSGGPFLEPLLAKAPQLIGTRWGCAALHAAAAPVLAWKRHRGWAATFAIALVKA